MSGLTESLNMAARAMQAQSYGLQIVGQNMANLNTPGYARRMLSLAEVPPGSGGGVRILGAPAQRDVLIEARLRRELPLAGQEAATADALSVVETSLGTIGSSIDSDMAKYFDAWRSLAQNPTSPVARDALAQQGQLLARSFNDMSTRLADSAREADIQVRGGISDINDIARNIASLNASIARSEPNDAESLQDQLGLQLDKLSELTSITVLRNEDGTANVTIGGGRAIVVGEQQYQLAVGNAPGTGYATVSLGGVDITSELGNGGKLGGYMDVRDTMVPAYRNQLDQLAFDIAQQVNSRHTAGTDLNGNTGNNFFTPIGAVAGAAAALAVDPALAGDPSRIAASQTGAVGDNQVAEALAQLRTARVANGGTNTFAESWSNLVYRVGNDTASAKADLVSRDSIVKAVSQLRDSVSGVSLDEEAANMIKYQRAYEANAKFFAAIGDTLDTLMTIV